VSLVQMASLRVNIERYVQTSCSWSTVFHCTIFAKIRFDEKLWFTVWTLSWENCIYQINVGTILSPIIPAPNSTSMSPASLWALNMPQCWQMHIRSCPWHLCLLLLLSVINRVVSLITLWSTLKFRFWFACSRHIYALFSFHCALWVGSLVHS